MRVETEAKVCAKYLYQRCLNVSCRRVEKVCVKNVLGLGMKYEYEKSSALGRSNSNYYLVSSFYCY